MFICCGNSPTVGLFLKPRLHVPSTSPFSFVSGTFDLFNVMCKQHHRNTLNPF